MKIPRTKNAIRNMLWGYVNSISNMILPFIFRTVMIKVLGEEYLGLNSLFTSILQVLSLSELGFGTAIIYSMYKPIAENNTEEICALLSFYNRAYRIIGTGILIIGTIILPFIPHLISGGYPHGINIYFVYYMFLLNTALSYYLFAYKSALLNGFQRNDLDNRSETITCIFRYSVEIFVIIFFRQYYLYLLINLVAVVLNNLVKLHYTNKYFPKYHCGGEINKIKKREIRSNVFALMVHKIGGTVVNSADNIVLSAFMGIAVVAKYTNYYYIMNSVDTIVLICFTGLTGGIGNSFALETQKKNRTNFKRVFFFNAWLVGWCSVCLLCLYQDFMRMWVGKAYMFSLQIVILLVIYFFVHAIRRTILVFRDGTGMWKDNQWQPIVSATVNIIVNIVLVTKIGVQGVLISTILSMVVIDIPWEAMVFCKQKIGWKSTKYFMYLIIYLGVTVIASMCTYFICAHISFSFLINLIIKGCICLVVPNLIFFIAYNKFEEFFYYKNLIKKLLTSKFNR